MFGEKLDLIVRQCCVCKRWFALRVDKDDLDRHLHGVFVQHAFVDRSGRPYLDSGERELLVSAVGPCCWALLCPTDKLAYS